MHCPTQWVEGEPEHGSLAAAQLVVGKAVRLSDFASEPVTVIEGGQITASAIFTASIPFGSTLAIPLTSPGARRFCKKPVEIEAVQFNAPGDHPAIVETEDFSVGYAVRGRQGLVSVDLGDWIIAELDGSGFYPCKPDVFAATYEEVVS